MGIVLCVYSCEYIKLRYSELRLARTNKKNGRCCGRHFNFCIREVMVTCSIQNTKKCRYRGQLLNSDMNEMVVASKVNHFEFGSCRGRNAKFGIQEVLVVNNLEFFRLVIPRNCRCQI